MATGEVKISALPLDVNPTGNDYAVTVDVDTNTNKKVPLSELSQALDKSKLLSSDAGNLITLGTDSNIKTDTGDLLSTDVGNIATTGTDNKVFVPSVALTLTQDNMFIGGVGNIPEEKTNLEVRQFLGLPVDYISDDIVYISSNQVSWQGKCRDSSDSRDFDLSSPVTASLVGATADTTYNLFVASNTLTDTPVVVWDTASVPSGYTYYRKVFYTKTNSTGSLYNFIKNKDGFVEYSDPSNRPFFSSSSIPTSYAPINIGTPAVKGTNTIISATITSSTSSVRTIEIANPDTLNAAVLARTNNNNAQINQGEVRTDVNGMISIKVDFNTSVSVFISSVGYYLEV